VVKLHLVNAPAGFAFVTVQSTIPNSACKPGAQGWALQETLEKL
jgi:hypothetical protein